MERELSEGQRGKPVITVAQERVYSIFYILRIQERKIQLPTIDLHVEIDPEAADEALYFVDGYIHEHPYKFLLDTGAGRSGIIADEFNAELESAGKSGGSGVFMPSNDDLVNVSAIQVGPLVQENMVVGRVKGGAANRPNIIGMDFWQHYRCEFLFDQNKLVIDQPDSILVTLYTLQTSAKCHPCVDVKLENITARAVWDTGASITIVDSNFIEKYPNLFTTDGASEGTDATGASFETPMYKMNACTIGDRAFPEVRVTSVDFSHINANSDTPMDMIVGYNILSKANWLFDFPNKKWAFINR